MARGKGCCGSQRGFFFFFCPPARRHMEFLGQGSEQPVATSMASAAMLDP